MHSSATLPKLILDDTSARHAALGFTLFLLLFETYVVRVDNAEAFVQLFASCTWYLIFIALGLVLGSLFITYRFFLAALSAGWQFRTLYLLIFAASLSAEYSYQKALGRFSNVLDVELALATSAEQKIESIAMYFGFASAVPVLVFLLLLAVTRGRRENGFRSFAAVNALIVVGLFAGSIVSVSLFPTVSPIAFYRTNVEFFLSGPIMHGEWAAHFLGKNSQRRPVQIPGPLRSGSPENNVVFVIDESVRGDHFSLNGYGRATTPFLDELQKRGILHNWGIAASASTGSFTSYNIMVTGLIPDDFPDHGQQKLKTAPTIFQYAKAMGYTTWFFDGQMDYFWGGVKEDRKYIDNSFGVNAIRGPEARDDWNIDIEIARRVNRVVTGSKGNFVFVFKHGSHVPYHRNFPPGETVWQPSHGGGSQFDIPGPEKLHEVVNAYDNSILFNVNSFFANLIDDYDRIPNNTIVVYTGDHGQTLFANGKASHSGNTSEEANVPLLIIGDLKNATVDTGFKASHHNLFPTILDLVDYPADLRERTTAISLLNAKAADSRQRFFNPSYGAKVAFDF